ncbi:phasin family protein [Halobacillus mangrovi]|uniref:phasin family protein n=1 Tax=Halobacillus mangrovi TaxID=402384 RepID=UPI003D991966
MNDLLKKGFYLGLGAAVSGKEKFEKMVEDMVNRKEISPSQAKSLMQSWINKGENVDIDWADQAKAKVQDRMKGLGFVSKKEYEILEARVQRLEKMLDQQR